MREVVESIVVAFVLAFLFRTFEAEAFVIPTGSMAPTLMGRHKDLVCPKCGYHFQASASIEIDQHTNRERGEEVIAATCPMCRFTVDLNSSEIRAKEDTTSFKGDRILVAKFPYQFSEPQRWDVVVFMYPGSAKTNYIKRLVGLPNETLMITHGDVFAKPKGEQEFKIARKPPDKILAMMQPVYDNDYVEKDLLAAGWPARWLSRDNGWQASEDLRSFTTPGKSSGENWLYYRHCVPTYEDWADILQRRPLRSGKDQRAQLVTDFTAYNTEQMRSTAGRGLVEGAGVRGMGPPPHPAQLGLHWVGDLIVQYTLRSESDTGQVLVDLVRGGRHFGCEIDLATGEATLSIQGVPNFQPKGATKVRGRGEHEIRLANVDDQLTLWVDGRVVKFDKETTYDSRKLDLARPQDADLSPAWIGSRGAAVEVSHLKLFRDLYYIAQRGGGPMSDYTTAVSDYPFTSEPPSAFFTSKEKDKWDAFKHLREVTFELNSDQFFMLGDNSAQSKDSRLWESEWPNQYFVERDLLKGKALYIYWPHSWDRTPPLPFFSRGIPFPFFPNVGRMGFVR